DGGFDRFELRGRQHREAAAGQQTLDGVGLDSDAVDHDPGSLQEVGVGAAFGCHAVDVDGQDAAQIDVDPVDRGGGHRAHAPNVERPPVAERAGAVADVDCSVDGADVGGAGFVLEVVHFFRVAVRQVDVSLQCSEVAQPVLAERRAHGVAGQGADVRVGANGDGVVTAAVDDDGRAVARTSFQGAGIVDVDV